MSSDVEGEYGVKSDKKGHQMSDQSKPIHNNQDIVAEKMANLREMIRASNETTSHIGHQLSKSAGANTTGAHTMRNIGHSGSMCCAAPTQQTHHYSHQTRRTASVCDDQHKTRQHNCPSPHSIPLQTNQSSIMTHKTVPNTGKTYNSTGAQISGERSGQPRAVQSVGVDSKQSNTTQPIRLQIDSLGNFVKRLLI